MFHVKHSITHRVTITKNKRGVVQLPRLINLAILNLNALFTLPNFLADNVNYISKFILSYFNIILHTLVRTFITYILYTLTFCVILFIVNKAVIFRSELFIIYTMVFYLTPKSCYLFGVFYYIWFF